MLDAAMAKRLAGMLSRFGEYATDPARHGFDDATPEGRAYAARQLNAIREEIAAADPLAAKLFPEIPLEASLEELGTIAGQMLDFISPADASQPRGVGSGIVNSPITINLEGGALAGIKDIGELVRNAVASAMGTVSSALEGLGAKAEEADRKAGPEAEPCAPGTEDGAAHDCGPAVRNGVTLALPGFKDQAESIARRMAEIAALGPGMTQEHRDEMADLSRQLAELVVRAHMPNE
ncbi:MAG TPA: hypothetical protein PLD23_16875 [Armatimonadota bacterium]|nr:hypothetical protein [Armatimonadota bacterium]HQK95176.1 hypothetical protein [Armatimonadota bacterium]